MQIRPIKTDEDYQTALTRISELMELADELEVLSVLVQEYESRTFPSSLPDPIEAIKFRMEQQNLRQRDLVPFIGSRSKVSEVLSGKRGLSLAMRQRLCDGLGIPAAVLLGKNTAAEAKGE